MQTGRRVRYRLLFSASAAALAVSAALPTYAQTAGADAAVGEVVVTAQKREQRLQEVPVSVTAIGAEQLERLQITSGSDIAKQVPNLRVSNLGNEDQPKFAMRGIATPEFNLNATSPTGVFYDEVYIATQWLGGPQVFDMERVEVLRGPQGTLFGKNTTGGAVNFITRGPSFGSGGYITGEAGSNNYFHATGAAETTLIEDKLAARVAFNFTQSDGWVKNNSRLAGARDLSSVNNHAIRLSLTYKQDDFKATLRLISSRSNPTNIGIIAYGVLPGNVQANGVNPRRSPYDGRPFSVHEGAYDRSGEIIANGDGGYLTMTKGLGPNLTLTSITSYFNGQFKNTVDTDGSIADFFSIDFFAKQNELSQDLRISSSFDGPINFIAGVYFTRDEVDIRTNFRSNGSPLFNQTYTQTRTSYAGYFDGTFDVTDALQVYGGVRWTSDHGRLHDYQVISGLPAFILPGVPKQPTIAYNDAKPTGRIGARYKATPDLMFYAQYARGYRSSAFNGGALARVQDLNVAKPETLNSYEIGFKSDWFERRLRINASAFYYDFRNQQFLNAVNVGGVQASQLANAGRARIQGLELEVVARPIPPLTLTAGLGLLDAVYKELVLPDAVTSVPTNLKGKRLIEAPKSTFNVAADYETAVGGDMTLNFHIDAVHVGTEYFTAFNNPLASSRPYWESNARVSLKDPSRHYELSLWVKNLNDNSEVAGAILNAANGTKFTTIPFPRRYGVSLNYTF
jgi:iron complex outermembrane recepter protein